VTPFIFTLTQRGKIGLSSTPTLLASRHTLSPEALDNFVKKITRSTNADNSNNRQIPQTCDVQLIKPCKLTRFYLEARFKSRLQNVEKTHEFSNAKKFHVITQRLNGKT